MYTYAIGDIQGCHDAFVQLLNKINYSDTDTLWIAGDLVNRGPKSLEVIETIRALSGDVKIVLGNHDLHLLSCYYTNRPSQRGDTLQALLNSPQIEDIAEWLSQQPLLIEHHELPVLLSHAGINPAWSIDDAHKLNDYFYYIMRDKAHRVRLLEKLYTAPEKIESLEIREQVELINAFTRMRLVDKHGNLDFSYKGTLEQKPNLLYAWFDPELLQHYENHPLYTHKVIFGHWSALMGQTTHHNAIALDTGCVWGNYLSAYCIETGEWTRHDE